MRIDRMGIQRPDTDTRTDAELYGSLFLVAQRKSNVNDYGGSEADAAKLANITNAAPGSTCLYSSGRIDRLELDGWAEFAENGAGTTQAAALTSFAPLTMGKSAVVTDTPLPEIEPELYTENAEPLDAVEVTENDK